MKEENIENNIKKLMTLIDELNENGIIDVFRQLNRSDYRILKYLNENKNANPSNIASSLNLTRPNIAAALKVLEKKEYITREINVKNRKQIFVNLTDSGREFVNICSVQLQLLLTSWFSSINDEEANTLFEILNKALNPNMILSELKEFTFGE